MEVVGRPHLRELNGHLELVVFDHRIAEVELVERADLVRIEELLHDQTFTDGADDDEVALAASRVLCQRPTPRLLQRLRQQRVGAVAALVRREIVRLLEVDRIDGRRRQELADLDGLRRLLFHRLQLFLVEEDVLPLGELVALRRLLARAGALVLRAEELLLDAVSAILVQHVEADLLAGLGGREEFHRDRNEAKRNLC